MLDFSAIVLDIDGTLLNSQGRLSDANLRALRECSRRGIVLYIATARPQRLVFRPGEATGDLAFITARGAFYNGAVAVDRCLGHFSHRPLSAELVRSVTDYLVEVALDLQIAIQNRDYYHSFRLPMDRSALRSWGFSQDELLPFSEACQRECSKIVAWSETQDLRDTYLDFLNQYSDRVNAFLTDAGRWLQLTAREASKEQALTELLSLRGITPEKVVAFGDDLPDMGMFSTFGCSIAMENSPEVLKELAAHVTRSNDEDGIAFALEEYLGVTP